MHGVGGGAGGGFGGIGANEPKDPWEVKSPVNITELSNKNVLQLTRKLERIDCILYFPFVESHLSIDCLYLTQELDKLNLLDQYQNNYQMSTLFPSSYSI